MNNRELEKRLKREIIERDSAIDWSPDVFLYWVYKHLVRQDREGLWSPNQIESRALRNLIEKHSQGLFVEK